MPLPPAPVANTPAPELASRWKRCRDLLHRYLPQAQGMLVFSRVNLYYFTGSLASGVFWLPLEGEPVLLCRRGLERARLESPVAHIYPFTSYRDIETVMGELNSTLPEQIAAEMNGLSWTLANSLTKHLPAHRFLSGDRILGMCRAVKSEWELAILREAGRRHARGLTELLPPLLHEGMSELEIAHTISDVFLQEGHHGILRMEGFGEEAFLGHIAVGDSANHPSVFNGPVGLRGVHPATPHMGAQRSPGGSASPSPWITGSPWPAT